MTDQVSCLDDKLEPEAKYGFQCPSDAALTSIAVSLKRIADAMSPPTALVSRTEYVPAASPEGDPLPARLEWTGEGPKPASWYAADGTKVYRSYWDYCDD